MKNTFKVLFYIKKNALLRNGNAPVMVRITINGERTHLSTQLSVAPECWEAGMGRVAGRGNAAERINSQLARIRYRIESCYNRLFCEEAYVTPLRVKELYLGVDRRRQTLLAFFRQHNEEFGRMVGISRSKTTYYKYRCVYSHLESYVREHYHRADLTFQELDREFLTGFHAYIARDCAHKKNTMWVYLIALKHILMLARSRGYLARDLFADYKLSNEFVRRNYLTIAEINTILGLEFSDRTLRLVRDAFLFSCFTGLSYVDLCSLTSANIQHENKQFWISTTRRKTGSSVQVRLMSVPHVILLKHMPEAADRRIFDLPSNGWCNKCLEKIVLAAGISRPITFHAARHTFATTITLSQGVAIETISKLLGHKNIRTTQIYASITRSKLDSDMERLSRRIDMLCPGRATADMVGK
ncbi:site-specific integrase [Alistipes sp.]|uniref:site-specific integrase n=1 Tax=Alistipes sp. TaxID=1872444 RepID=UPI003AF115E7